MLREAWCFSAMPKLSDVPIACPSPEKLPSGTLMVKTAPFPVSCTSKRSSIALLPMTGKSPCTAICVCTSSLWRRQATAGSSLMDRPCGPNRPSCRMYLPGWGGAWLFLCGRHFGLGADSALADAARPLGPGRNAADSAQAGADHQRFGQDVRAVLRDQGRAWRFPPATHRAGFEQDLR